MLAISPTEILAGEVDYPAPARFAYEIQHLTRYELSRFDDLEKAW